MKSCRLAVLSACATAASDLDGAWNPDGLVRAFLRAGAAEVVASRWNVDSEATAELMEAFYRSVAAGAAPGEALEAASREIRARHGRSHPHYWAAFHLFER